MKYVYSILLLILAGDIMAADWSAESDSRQTVLLELFTSEGCSSCPPAERWIGTLQNNNKLWSGFIPLAFHVDYWDYLGWKDKFADERFTRRQQRYRQSGYVNSVYTPGVFVNGRPWQGWRYGSLEKLDEPRKKVGRLKATLSGNTLSVIYKSAKPANDRMIAHVVELGFDIESDVRRGENAGRKLLHNFVVTQYKHLEGNSQNNEIRWSGMFIPRRPNNRSAIVVWLTRGNDPKPLQAVGGWLLNE